MDRDAAHKALIKLAKHTAAMWQHIRGEAFVGETTVETANTLYRFQNGIFAGRAKKPAPNEQPVWETPDVMKGVELIGFFADEGGLWSLAPRWREGSLAVITSNNPASRFTLTSPTLSCVIERPDPARVPTVERSDVFEVPTRRPPTVRRPAPPSMTKLQPVPTR